MLITNKLIAEMNQEVEAVTSPERITSIVSNELNRIPLAKHLEAHGAGPKDIARVVSRVMNHSDSDSMQLQAAKLAAEMSGLYESSEQKQQNIVIIVKGDNVSVDSGFLPRNV